MLVNKEDVALNKHNYQFKYNFYLFSHFYQYTTIKQN